MEITKSAIATDTMCNVRWVTDNAKRIYVYVLNKLKHEMKTNEEEDGGGDDDDDGEQRKKERKRTSKQANEQQSLPSASHKNLGLVK